MFSVSWLDDTNKPMPKAMANRIIKPLKIMFLAVRFCKMLNNLEMTIVMQNKPAVNENK